MYSEAYLAGIEADDPVLAQQLRQGTPPQHKPVWDSNGLTETIDLSDDQAKALVDWTFES